MIFLALILPGVGYGPAIDLKGVGPKSALPRLRVLSLFVSSNERHLSAEDLSKKPLASHGLPGCRPGSNRQGCLCGTASKATSRYLTSVRAGILIASSVLNAAGSRSSTMQPSRRARKKLPDPIPFLVPFIRG